MNRLHLIMVALAICFVPHVDSAETPPRAQHNFLFVIDSSISMEPRKAAAIKWVREAIASRFDGQIEAGDSIDIWTYDTENNLNGFPPQIWTPSTAKRISDDAAQYLEKYKFKGRSEFANVITDLDILIPQTKSLLVVVITDGEQPFSGFPLDLEINGYLAKKGKLGAHTPNPLLISLAAINGKIRTWTAYFGEGNMGLASLPGRKAAPPVAVAEKKPAAVPPSTAYPAPQASRVSPKIDANIQAPSIFNFPPGTLITPVDATPTNSSADKPLEVLVAEKLAQARSAKTNVAAKTNVVAKTAAPITVTNIAASPTLTNSAKPLASTAPATNVIEQKTVHAAPIKPTNAIALSTTNQQATNAIVAAATTKPPTVGPNNSSNDNAPAVVAPSRGLGADWTVQRTFYIAGTTGASCFLVGLFLLYRRFRRPTQSIISRSLLQR